MNVHYFRIIMIYSRATAFYGVDRLLLACEISFSSFHSNNHSIRTTACRRLSREQAIIYVLSNNQELFLYSYWTLSHGPLSRSRYGFIWEETSMLLVLELFYLVFVAKMFLHEVQEVGMFSNFSSIRKLALAVLVISAIGPSFPLKRDQNLSAMCTSFPQVPHWSSLCGSHRQWLADGSSYSQ